MELEKGQAKKFEDIKHIDENGDEFWLARELQGVLGYAKWQTFSQTINRAMVSCKINQQDPHYHFTDISKMVEMPSGIRDRWEERGEQMGFTDISKTHKAVLDYRLTRY